MALPPTTALITTGSEPHHPGGAAGLPAPPLPSAASLLVTRVGGPAFVPTPSAVPETKGPASAGAAKTARPVAEITPKEVIALARLHIQEPGTAALTDAEVEGKLPEVYARLVDRNLEARDLFLRCERWPETNVLGESEVSPFPPGSTLDELVPPGIFTPSENDKRLLLQHQPKNLQAFINHRRKFPFAEGGKKACWLPMINWTLGRKHDELRMPVSVPELLSHDELFLRDFFRDVCDRCNLSPKKYRYDHDTGPYWRWLIGTSTFTKIPDCISYADYHYALVSHVNYLLLLEPFHEEPECKDLKKLVEQTINKAEGDLSKLNVLYKHLSDLFNFDPNDPRMAEKNYEMATIVKSIIDNSPIGAAELKKRVATAAAAVAPATPPAIAPSHKGRTGKCVIN